MTRITGCIFIDNIDIVQPYFTKMLPSKFIVGHKISQILETTKINSTKFQFWVFRA